MTHHDYSPLHAPSPHWQNAWTCFEGLLLPLQLDCTARMVHATVMDPDNKILDREGGLLLPKENLQKIQCLSNCIPDVLKHHCQDTTHGKGANKCKYKYK